MQFTWNEDAMGTGVPLIDAQHRGLIARYNRFHDALLEGQGREHLLHVLEFLIAYANIHFPQEEALMDLHDCPVAEPNRVAHRELVDSLLQVREQIRRGGTTITAAIDVESKIASWLRTHICKVDVKLRATPASSYFRQKSA